MLSKKIYEICSLMENSGKRWEGGYKEVIED